MTTTKRNEVEIQVLKTDICYIKKTIESNHLDLKEDLKEIKEKLLGNGKKGIIDEISEFKGGLVATRIIFSILFTIMGLLIAYLTFIKK